MVWQEMGDPKCFKSMVEYIIMIYGVNWGDYYGKDLVGRNVYWV